MSWTTYITTPIKRLLTEPYMLNHLATAIALPTSRLTSGAGELTTLAFRVDPRTRSFGEPNARLLTANPSKPVNSSWTMFQTKLNPVVLAAVE